MKKEVIQEIKSLIKKWDIRCSLEEFKDKVNWNGLSIYQTLSLEFIREFKDKINWVYISKHQKLSEKFIREFKDKVNWNYISRYQPLSLEFIYKFKHKLDIDYLIKNNKITKQQLEEIIEKDIITSRFDILDI